MATEPSRARGRPRRFNLDEAVAKAQQLFHEKGYDAVSVADLTRTLGINPPSFYLAFGSKADFYARILERYNTVGAIPLQEILREDRPLSEALSEVLEWAARAYAADPATSGCLVLEGTRSDDPQARDASATYFNAAQNLIRAYIAERRPQDADRLADFVCTTMAGLSASARHGQSISRLLSTAVLASSALATALHSEQ